jgi:hypothetical protein
MFVEQPVNQGGGTTPYPDSGTTISPTTLGGGARGVIDASLTSRDASTPIPGATTGRDAAVVRDATVVSPEASTPPPPADTTACVANIFSQKCGGVDCHGAGSKQLDLVSPGVRARLLSQPSLGGLPCAGRVYIATDGSPSLLLEKLDRAPVCGMPMPPSSALSKPASRCLTDWVLSLGGSEFDAGPH